MDQNSKLGAGLKNKKQKRNKDQTAVSDTKTPDNVVEMFDIVPRGAHEEVHLPGCHRSRRPAEQNI